MRSTFRRNIAAAMMLLGPIGAGFVAQPAAAQYYQAEQGRVTGMSLNSSAGLAPGATLRVQVYATPRARWANATLGDSGVRVALRERAPGEYVGTHVIRRGERIDPTQLMRVRASWGEGPVAVSFNYPPSFQALAMGAAPAAPGRAMVSSFRMMSRGDVEPGEVVRFRLEGTPRARASVSVPGVVRGLPMREVRPGVYVARYTVRAGDDFDAFHDARAVLRSGDQRVVARMHDRERVGYGYGR